MALLWCETLIFMALETIVLYELWRCIYDFFTSYGV